MATYFCVISHCTIKITTRAPTHYRNSLSRYGGFRYKEETVFRPSYHYNSNSYTGKIASWYWDTPLHDDVIQWKHFPRYWLFVRGIHRSPVNFPHKGQWHGALLFSLICTRINGWVNNREAVEFETLSCPLCRNCNRIILCIILWSLCLLSLRIIDCHFNFRHCVFMSLSSSKQCAWTKSATFYVWQYVCWCYILCVQCLE